MRRIVWCAKCIEWTTWRNMRWSSLIQCNALSPSLANRPVHQLVNVRPASADYPIVCFCSCEWETEIINWRWKETVVRHFRFISAAATAAAAVGHLIRLADQYCAETKGPHTHHSLVVSSLLFFWNPRPSRISCTAETSCIYILQTSVLRMRQPHRHNAFTRMLNVEQFFGIFRSHNEHSLICD